MKIALVHDWITGLTGAERVLKELHAMFPTAPVYTLFARQAFARNYMPHATIRTSFLQRIPGIWRWYPVFLPLMPLAVESFDLSGYDLVISSSAIFAKGLILKPRTAHICYCYSPSRLLWDRHAEYERRGFLHTFARHALRVWDRQAAERVDRFVAISETVQQRIAKYYHRDSNVVYPPATQLIDGTYTPEIRDYYLIVSRLYPHKNIGIAVEAFNKLGLPLVVIGDGPERKRLGRLARPNIIFLGHQPDDRVAAYYRHCKAFIMPQEEDFGLTAVEAMQFGKPVLALRRGGAMEILQEGVTGEFFDDPIPEAIAEGVKRLNENLPKYGSGEIQKSVGKFSTERFRREIMNIVNETGRITSTL